MSELTLNITNGDCAVEALKNAGIQGDFLPWRDVLHIGPLLPGKLSGRFEQSRVLFLSQYFDLDEDEVRQKFSSRHELFANLSQYQTIRLWFEHDLYDQLQLVQILVYLGQQGFESRVSWVVTDHYIGPANESDIQELFRFDQPVHESCWPLAVKIWNTLTQADPTQWRKFLTMNHADWPFLSGALQRLQSEFPDKVNGLSMTQTIILDQLSQQVMDTAALFKAVAAEELAVFMGDAVFIKELRSLAEAKYPLIRCSNADSTIDWHSRCEITATGKAVSVGEKNHVKLNGIDRWIAGVHLKSGNCWWFNKAKKQLEL